MVVESLAGKTVLLVEDEAIIALDEQAALERYGLEVATVFSGAEAIATMDQRSDIDLILMDINLGRGMDGTEAAQAILAKHEVPLVFLSSHTEREVLERTEGITSYGYIVKNSGETVLIASIKMAFRLFEATANARAHERTARAERDRARMYLDIAGVVIVALDTDGRVTMLNRRAREVLGYEEAEIVGRKWFEVTKPQSGTRPDPRAWPDLMTGRRRLIEYGENTVRTKQGAYRTLAWHHRLLHDLDGTIVGTLSSGEDITERVAAERVLERERRLSTMLARLAASFVDCPAHDLDENINEALGQLGRFLELDAAGLLTLTADGRSMEPSHFWSASGSNPAPQSFGLSDYCSLVAGFQNEKPQTWTTARAVATSEGSEAGTVHMSGSFALIPVSVGSATGSCLAIARVSSTEAFTAGVLEDLTRLARVFSSALARHQTLQSIADVANSVPGVVYQCLTDQDGNTSFPFVSRGAEKHYGIPAEALIRDPQLLAQRVHPADREAFHERLAACMSSMQRFKMVHRFVTQEGAIRWMDVRSTPRRLGDGSIIWNGVSIDITDRKVAEERVAEEARFARAIGDSVPALLYVYDVPSARNVWANRRHREYFAANTNVDPAELTFEHIAALVHPDDLPTLLARHQEMEADPERSAYEVEARMRHGDEWRWMLLFVAAFRRSADGALKQVVGTLFDISRRKHAELQVAAANERLETLLAERNMLMREVNHRVKNNLLMVCSLLGLREAAANVDLSDVKNQVASIGHVHDLLHGAEDATQVNVEEFFQRVLHSALGSESQIRTRVEPATIPPATAVPLGLLVNELATNAVRHGFTDAGERIFSLQLSRDAHEFVLIAENSGRPFPPDVDPRHAQSFGLRLVDSLVRQLRGTFELERQPRTRITIRFPALEGNLRQSEA